MNSVLNIYVNKIKLEPPIEICDVILPEHGKSLRDFICLCGPKPIMQWVGGPKEEPHSCIRTLNDLVTFYKDAMDGKYIDDEVLVDIKHESTFPIFDLPYDKFKHLVMVTGCFKTNEFEKCKNVTHASRPMYWFNGQHMSVKNRLLQVPSKMFSSHNNKERESRSILYTILKDRDMLDYMYYSYVGKDILLVGETLGDGMPGHTHLPYYHDALFDVICETDCDDSTIRWTEKTVRALESMKPFLIFGTPGINKLVADMGFRLYDCIDYSFDDEKDIFKRANMLVDEMQRLLTIPIKELYDDTRDTAVYNYTHCEVCKEVDLWHREGIYENFGVET